MQFMPRVIVFPALLAGLAAAWPASTAEPGIWLEVGGAADLAFEGTCTVETAAGSEAVQLDARVPYRRGFDARRIDCRLGPSERGRLDIVLRSAQSGVKVRSAIAGGPGSTANIALSR